LRLGFKQKEKSDQKKQSTKGKKQIALCQFAFFANETT